MIDPENPAMIAAVRFCAEHQGEHLSADSGQLIARCRQHVVDHFPVSDRRATTIATHAWGEAQAKGAAGFIDADLTTSYVVVVFDTTTRRRHVVGLAELLALVRARPVPDAAHAA